MDRGSSAPSSRIVTAAHGFRSTLRTIVLLVTALIAGFAMTLLATGPAQAEGARLVGELVDPATNSGVPGVLISATGPDGFSDQTESQADGTWALDIPGAGDYVVTIDPATLPEGLTLRDPETTSRTVNVFAARDLIVRFPLGEGQQTTTAWWSTIPQLTVDGLLIGIQIGLAAVGLSLIFGTTKLTTFAHGEMIALGALLTFFFSSVVGLPLILAAVLGVIASAYVGGWAQNQFLWRPLRRRGTGLIAMLVVSIGLGFLLRYFFLFIFGGQTRTFNQYAGQPGIEIGPVLIAPKDLIAGAIGIALILLTAWWLLRTRAGKATRAVADNPALASASGIDVEKVIRQVWILGVGLAAYAGVMVGLQVGVSWFMGFQLLLLVFAGTVLGGLGTAFGAIVGSLIVGLFIQLSTVFVPTELKYVGALLVLILILLVKPEGILGRKERIG